MTMSTASYTYKIPKATQVLLGNHASTYSAIHPFMFLNPLTQKNNLMKSKSQGLQFQLALIIDC